MSRVPSATQAHDRPLTYLRLLKLLRFLQLLLCQHVVAHLHQSFAIGRVVDLLCCLGQ